MLGIDLLCAFSYGCGIWLCIIWMSRCRYSKWVAMCVAMYDNFFLQEFVIRLEYRQLAILEWGCGLSAFRFKILPHCSLFAILFYVIVVVWLQSASLSLLTFCHWFLWIALGILRWLSTPIGWQTCQCIFSMAWMSTLPVCSCILELVWKGLLNYWKCFFFF